MNVNNTIIKARSDGGHLCQRKTLTLFIFIIGIVVMGTVRINHYQLNVLPQSEEDDTNKVIGSGEDDKEEQRPLDSKSKWQNNNSSEDMSVEVEQLSRAYPVWINNRRLIDSNSRPYDWCVSEDIAKNDDSPKGLLFVKVDKSGSSTGAGVTLRIRDGLSRRLSHANQTASINCFAHYEHSNAKKLGFQKRDASQSFLWSIVREPAQRSLSHYFFFHASRNNRTATEDRVISALKNQPLGKNYQSKYLDLPNQTMLAPSKPADRIINGYDFLAVNERMDESLVVLALLARVPLADVVVFSSKIAGGYDGGGSKRGCVKIKKKWTTPKIDEYILDDYKSANRDDYLLYDAAQRSLDKTIDALGRQRVEKNVALLKRLRLQNEEECASEVTWPCPEPEDQEEKEEHKRLTSESCYELDLGCGHACTDVALADHAEAEWANITSLQYQD